MKQLSLIHPIVTRKKRFEKTRKNESAMKQCFREVYKIGMVKDETMLKIERTDYAGEI